MELLLNSVWALVGIAIVCLWLQHERSNKTDRRLPFIALVMLIVILFPVISVSDDLWSIQNPAETDTCQRRNHLGNSPHSVLHPVSAIPTTAFAGITFCSRFSIVPLEQSTVYVENPAFRSIQNRPPPAV
jgi:hypothetical protein